MSASGRLLRRFLPVFTVILAIAFGSIWVSTRQPQLHERRMSFDNRLLLNRTVVSGLRTLEVLVLAREAGTGGVVSGIDEIARLLTKLGGRANRTERAIGYMRVEVPTERLLELADSPAIDAYQIASLSRGAWYRDTPPLINAEMFRDYEVTPIAATEPAVTHADLPSLTPAEARAPGFTADDVGVGRWLEDHPTYDGRGVTIAIIEGAAPSFTNATVRAAKTLDGRDVPKIAGILNALNPAIPDGGRVHLDTVVEAPKSWTRIGGRTYVLPHPGRYRFGTLDVPAGANVIHRFAVVEDQSTHDVWIDTNGDASFQDETALADVNERFDPRLLTLTHPRKAEVSFVMARGREPHVVHFYLGKGSHLSMTLSVAAGSRTNEGLAFGVAPNARVLLVLVSYSETGVVSLFEGFIAAAQRPDVDVISSSNGIMSVPDTAADFAGALMRRLVSVYQKPIVIGAGNTSQTLTYIYAFGSVLSVGGVLSPATYASLYGGRALEQLIVHSISAAGPSLDGAIKPDVLAPIERLAADLPWNTDIDAAPRNAPTRRIPPGYQVSCCTSASAPYAAGVVALLTSAAKQAGVPVNADRVYRALKGSARAVPGFQAHQQGNGAIDVNAAWLELSRPPVDLPRIVASAAIVHPLAQYGARGPVGEGILEIEGWRAGMEGTRDIVLRRESGPPEPVSYRIGWSANDGTFSTAPSVTLPLGKPVTLPVHVHVKTPGAHSGLLRLHDTTSNAVVFRTQTTIVAAEQFDPSTGSLRVTATIGLMRQRAHYVQVPAGVGAIAFDLEITRGVIRPTIVPSSGLHSGYYMHVHPNNLELMGKGRYQIVLPNPEPGTWTFQVNADSTWTKMPGNPVPADNGDADYTLTMRLFKASIRPAATSGGAVAAEITNGAGTIVEPVVEATPGYLTSHRGRFLSTGLPNAIDISVPANAATLSLQLRAEPEGSKTELYLYDCTTGECFSYNFGFPAAGAHTLVVRKPNAGRWVAAVNAAPFPAAAGGFVLDEVITTGAPIRRASTAARASGARWQEVIGDVPAPPAAPGKMPIVLLELRDAALERAEADHPWAVLPRFKLRDRPVALGSAIFPR
jgi:subtilase family protein